MPDNRFAVLIDADNISDKYIQIIMDEVSNDGVITCKRIYGDWTQPNLASWKPILLDYSIIPIQQYSYTTGKNATDSAMIIDAMDLLYSQRVDGFCIVSSDSDFTRLAARLRESGMLVIGMGEKKTPKAFIAACNRFKYLDILATADQKPQKSETKPKKAAKPDPAPKEKEQEMTSLTTIKKAILTISRENSDEDGWISVGAIGNLLGKRYPDFDVRNFGFPKLTPFLESLDLFDIKTSRNRDGSAKMISVKLK